MKTATARYTPSWKPSVLHGRRRLRSSSPIPTRRGMWKLDPYGF